MKLAGIILIVYGLIEILFEEHPTKEEKKVKAHIDELEKSKSISVYLIDNRKLNVGFIALGLICVIFD